MFLQTMSICRSVRSSALPIVLCSSASIIAQCWRKFATCTKHRVSGSREDQSVMAKAPKSKAIQKPQDVELIEDAWPHFEALVKSAAKMGHKPHDGAKQAATKKLANRKKT